MIRRKITLRGTVSTPLIEEWAEKIPVAIEKQITDESAIVDIEIRLLPKQASGEKFFVEATLSVQKNSFHAEAENGNLLSAIEIVRDGIITELNSKKKKQERFVRRGGRMFKDFIRRNFS